MAALRCLFSIRNAAKIAASKPHLAPVFVRHHWNRDWKPGPVPQTPEEHEAAARKYNLRPEDYKTHPDDGLGYGDYPNLPPVSADSRDPFYNWDHPELRRNFGEPLHVQSDMYGEDRYDINAKPRYSIGVQYMAFIGVVGGSFLVYYFLENYKMFRPVLPKQYPDDGKVHYTFEPES